MRDDPSRRQLGTYPFTLTLGVRYSDLDPQAHVNNVGVAEYYQELRVRFYDGLAGSGCPAGSRALIAHHAMDFLAEIEYPGEVTVGLRVARVGRSSYTLEQGLFQGGRCTGVAVTIMVHAESGGPAALTAGMRSYLERFRGPESP